MGNALQACKTSKSGRERARRAVSIIPYGLVGLKTSPLEPLRGGLVALHNTEAQVPPEARQSNPLRQVRTGETKAPPN